MCSFILFLISIVKSVPIYNIVYLYLSTLRCSQNKSDFVAFHPFFLHIFYLSSLFRFFSSFYPFFRFFRFFLVFFSSFFRICFSYLIFQPSIFRTPQQTNPNVFFLAGKTSLRLKSILIPSIHYVHLHLDVLLSCNSPSFCYQIRETLAYALFKSKKTPGNFNGNDDYENKRQTNALLLDKTKSESDDRANSVCQLPECYAYSMQCRV